MGRWRIKILSYKMSGLIHEKKNPEKVIDFQFTNTPINQKIN